MKILWFSLSPCGSARKDNIDRLEQGWMISLEDEIKKNDQIDLYVSFISEKLTTPFYYEKVHYYPIYQKKSSNGIKRVLSRYKKFQNLDKLILPKIIKIVNEIKPELIHIHGTEESFGLIQDFITDIPIVFSIQGLIAPIKEKYFTGISYEDLKKNESLYDKIRRMSYLYNYKSFCYRAEREKKYLSKANYIFGRTFWDKNCTLALNPSRKYFILNEILRPEFYNKNWKGFISNNKIKIISTVSLGFYKGYETILKTASLLLQYTKLDFEWHVIGYDKNSKILRISEKTTSLKSEECNIMLHGRINAEDLSNLLCNSDIYAHVSHIENSPNAVCEAMLIGIPIIASYAGGTASIISHEKEGILYQDGDPYVLAGTIIQMIQNPNQTISYAKNAHETAMSRHDKKNIIEELVNGYQAIIKDYHLTKDAKNKIK